MTTWDGAGPALSGHAYWPLTVEQGARISAVVQ
jgi:hypothetical protein